MTYKELQQVLKEYRKQGLTNIKLNRKKVELQAEYDKLQASVYTLKTGEFFTDGQSLIDEPKEMGIAQIMYYLNGAKNRGLDFSFHRI